MKIQSLILAGVVSLGFGVCAGMADPTSPAGTTALDSAVPHLDPPVPGVGIAVPPAETPTYSQPVTATPVDAPAYTPETVSPYTSPNGAGAVQANTKPTVKVVTREVVVVKRAPPRVIIVQAPAKAGQSPVYAEPRTAVQAPARLALETGRCASSLCMGHVFGVGF